MRARLRWSHEGVTVLLVVCVEEHLAAGGSAVFDSQGPQREYDRDRGWLMLDDGRRVNAEVDGPFLRQVDPDS
jgi:hypothetical protein